LLLVIATVAVLAATVAGLGGELATLADATLWSAVLKDTDFGRVWSARLLMGAALVAISVGVAFRPALPMKRAGLWFVGGLVVTVALTGHAQIEDGAAGWAHRLADATHLLAAAAWLGALPPLLLLLRRSGEAGDALRAANRLRAFHTIGIGAVALLIMTGAVNSWFLVGSVQQLITTGYGNVLLIKLALFGAMFLLAASNRLRLVPLLSRDLAGGADPEYTLARLRLRIRGELALGLLVLLAVAVLGAIEPASP
jgi:putative copper resistance protein D